jgi:two-component system, cell cycle response regulator DivK
MEHPKSNDRLPMYTEIDPARWTVLIVDDEPDNVGVAEKVLTFYGSKVFTANDGIKALEMLMGDLMPDLILLDISMPHMDGWAVLRAIRELPGHTQTPIIAVTAHAMDGDRQRILDGGFDGYIAKPFHLRHFVDAIKEVMRGIMSRRQS